MKRSKLVIIAFVLASLIGPQVSGRLFAADEEIIKKGELLNLERCVQIALKRQPNIVAAMNTVNVSQSRIGQARSGYYPQIDISAGYNRVSSATSASGGPTGGTSNRSFDQYSSSATIKQTLYDFGKTDTQVRIQTLGLDTSRSDLDNITSQILYNVKQAYFGLLQAKRNRNVSEETVRQFQQHLEQAKGFYEVGTKPKFDVTKAEVDLSNARLSLMKAENAIRLSVATLNNALGVPNAPEYAIEDNLSFKKNELTFDEALSKAYSGRSDLNSALLKKQTAVQAIELAKKGYNPVLSGNAGYNWAGEKLDNMKDGWNIGMAVSVPLFSGYLTKYQIEESRANLDLLKTTEELIRQNIFLDVQQSHLNLKDAEERIPTAELAVRQAAENLEIANGRYAAGVGSPVEVTDAQVSYTNAKTAHIQALSDYKVAWASLEKAMGVR